MYRWRPLFCLCLPLKMVLVGVLTYIMLVDEMAYKYEATSTAEE